jgi:sugar phosphate isomerase/epimerase
VSLVWPDLVWSHFSRPRHGEFDQRVAAAAAAGFAGVGLYTGEYRRMRDDEGRSVADIGDVLAEHGVRLAEVEVVTGWWADAGPMHDACADMERTAFEMADAFGVRYLQAIGGHDYTEAEAVRGFGALCDRAAQHGLLVGIEWLPFTNIPDAASAQRIVEAADRPNGGYCADIWHHVRGADDIEMVRALGGERIFAVQMNDGTRHQQARADNPDGDYKRDCLLSRVPPGDGEFGCAEFIAELMHLGVTAPISVEVCSAEWWAAPVDAAARAAADGMRRVLQQVGVN